MAAWENLFSTEHFKQDFITSKPRGNRLEHCVPLLEAINVQEDPTLPAEMMHAQLSGFALLRVRAQDTVAPHFFVIMSSNKMPFRQPTPARRVSCVQAVSGEDSSARSHRRNRRRHDVIQWAPDCATGREHEHVHTEHHVLHTSSNLLTQFVGVLLLPKRVAVVSRRGETKNLRGVSFMYFLDRRMVHADCNE